MTSWVTEHVRTSISKAFLVFFSCPLETLPLSTYVCAACVCTGVCVVVACCLFLWLSHRPINGGSWSQSLCEFGVICRSDQSWRAGGGGMFFYVNTGGQQLGFIAEMKGNSGQVHRRDLWVPLGEIAEHPAPTPPLVHERDWERGRVLQLKACSSQGWLITMMNRLLCLCHQF